MHQTQPKLLSVQQPCTNTSLRNLWAATASISLLLMENQPAQKHLAKDAVLRGNHHIAFDLP